MTLLSLPDYWYQYQTLSFKTAHTVYLGRFEALTLSLTQKMQNHRPPAPTVAPTPVAKTSSLAPPIGVSNPAGGSRSGTPMPEDAATGGVGATGAAGGGTKKKPKKKKK
jgi:signal recognition particle subunit SRP9